MLALGRRAPLSISSLATTLINYAQQIKQNIYIYTDQLVINSTCHRHRMVLLWGRKQL